ncbi:MAG: hypothetical protein PWQ41_2072 [Bacillota bacterium]|nr:hypothetical protein [Bacillota bacterium]MDK2926298.1 hypothetical protein [Bacillota bacterium]MDK2960341.1 hypothetical protein [Bacillota bacterium]
MTGYCPFQVLTAREVRCELGKGSFSPKDSEEPWACAGCSIPRVLANRPCIYLEPVKHFALRGKSITFFRCTMFGVVIDEPFRLCPQCVGNEPAPRAH